MKKKYDEPLICVQNLNNVDVLVISEVGVFIKDDDFWKKGGWD